MRPIAGDRNEEEGVLNPAAIRGRDGELYLFPRLVARGNYSRIGIARVLFSDGGDPVGVERLGIALEPREEYEMRPDGGGCEDPRITFVEPLNRFVMTYTAFSSKGPRIAIAVSEDLFSWERLGLASFQTHQGIEFDGIDNKDALIFPIAIPAPDGRLTLAMVHRPLFPGTTPEKTVQRKWPRCIDIQHESIWISYSFCPLTQPCNKKLNHLCHFESHRRLASPASPWEKLKIGGGAPPILTKHGWMLLYHGVSAPTDTTGVSYHAGVMILDKHQPHLIRYRSAEPIMSPDMEGEKRGVVENVVFPTGLDHRIDIDQNDRFDVYFGMADSQIGVASLTIPEELPPTGVSDVCDVNQAIPLCEHREK